MGPRAEKNKYPNTEAAAHRCSVALTKNQKQPLADYALCKIFKNSFFHKTPLVAASEKLINFQENIISAVISGENIRRNRFIFLANTTE